MTKDVPSTKFDATITDDGVLLRLVAANGRSVSPAEWIAAAPNAAGALAHVFARAEDEGDSRDVTVRTDQVHLSPGFVAALTSSNAAALGLPATTPLALDLKSYGILPDQQFRVDGRWVRPGGAAVRAEVRGAFIESEGNARRIPEPLYSVWSAAQALREPLPEPDRYAAFAALREVMPADARAAVESNAYLADTRICYATNVSLSVGRSDAFDFDPVLFADRAVRGAADENRSVDEIDDKLLTRAAQKLFAEDRFRRQPTGRPAYVLRDGEYIFIDPGLRPVLNEIRRLQDAPVAERRKFLSNPRRTLAERINDPALLADLENRFVETDQFSQRVSGVDIWRMPVLPWIKPGKNTWFPERFGLRLGENDVVITPANAIALHDRLEAAAADGQDEVAVADLAEPGPSGEVPPDSIPVNSQSRSAVGELAKLARSLPTGEQSSAIERSPAADVQKLFLVIRDNLEEVEFSSTVPESVGSSTTDSPEIPDRVTTQLKPHQRDGFGWQCSAYNAGKPGVLLADDMGLGKTLQAITFMAWLQDRNARNPRERLPFLVVAPTGLLSNWREEIELHLAAPRLGEIVLAFGSNLKELREEGFSGRDVESGRAGLDLESWAQAGVVLTTYETLRDYHFSFARSRFGLIVFDEIQKLKNPASQLTRAAKTLNGRFTVGMTGTPVENRMQDLWSIMDTIAPGLLGSSKQFEAKYPSDSPEKLRELKRFLSEPHQGPPAMLRRLKADHLPGLPEKHSHEKKVVMPPVQADAYRDLVRRAIASRQFSSRPGGMLSLLHEMRGVSLHPVDPAHAPPDLNAYASDSARLSWTLEVLEAVARTKEKALVFVESLAMQERLATLIQSKFSLPSAPMRINGSVPGHKRQQLVHRFQQSGNLFDVMILSPKAGGVGLNLTAANHVIHLSRWWNPAVEDQSTDRCFRIGQTKPVHVYLPMAVHPDPTIGPASFDLSLNALLEKKRRLSRDMLAPMDGSDADLSELFDSVSLVAGVSQSEESESTAVVVPPAISAPTKSSAARPILSLAGKSDAPPPFFTLTAKKGDARPLHQVVNLFSRKRVGHVLISDPFSLVDVTSRAAQVKFLRALADQARSIEAVTFEFAPEASEEPERNQVHDVRSRLAVAFSNKPMPKVAFSPKRKGRRGPDDFHDREITIGCIGAGGAVQQHLIWIGRGLLALVDQNWSLRLTYQVMDGRVGSVAA